MGEDEKTSLSRVEFWQRVAAVAFSLWAAVVGFVGVVVRDSVSEAVKENKISRESFAEYVRVMERRVTVIEERQNSVLATLRDFDGRIDSIENGRRQPR